MTKNNLPWLKEYKVFGIPKTFKPYPKKSVVDILKDTAKKYKKQGVVQLNYKLTYPEMLDHVNRLATALHAMVPEKGERVATMLPTSIQFEVADYAISAAGLVQIPTSNLEPTEQLVHKFKEGTPEIMICFDEYLDAVKALLKKTKIKHVIITSLKDYSNEMPESYKEIKIKGVQCYWMKELIRDNEPNPPEVEFDVDNDIETLLFTGGTTGLAKGCMLTHRNIYANAVQSGYAMGLSTQLVKGAIGVLIGMPFFHSYGHSIVHSMTMAGFDQILINDPRDTASMVEMIKKYRPFIQMGVPTQFMKLLEEDLDDVFMVGISGSAPLPQNTQEALDKKNVGGIMEGYGLSEMSPTTHMNTSYILRINGGRFKTKLNTMLLKIPGNIFIINGFLRLLGSERTGRFVGGLFSFLLKHSDKKEKKVPSGKKQEKRGTIGIPFPDTEIKIVDISTGKDISWDEVAAGKTGEMYLSGPQRMLGYWPKANNGIDENGYIHTGDVVKVDDRGYFYIVDRTKDMIIISGFKVYSRELDDILYQHSSVEMAATVGIPDPERQGSERVVVYIQLKPGHKKKTKEKDIIEFLKTKVAKYAVPKAVKFVDELPLTEVQKVNKKVIREMAVKEFSKNGGKAKTSSKKKSTASSKKKPGVKKAGKAKKK